VIAGCSDLTFIDYSSSHDITSASNKIIVTGGFGDIHDVAPLVGPGSQAVPEQAAWLS
jgi:hypothetical protein